MSIEYNYVRFPASLENVTDLNYKVLYILDTLGMDAVACESPRPPRRARYPEPAPLPRLPAERPVHRWRGSIQTSSRLRLHDCSTSALPCPTKPGHTRRAPCDATAAPRPLLSNPPPAAAGGRAAAGAAAEVSGRADVVRLAPSLARCSALRSRSCLDLDVCCAELSLLSVHVAPVAPQDVDDPVLRGAVGHAGRRVACDSLADVHSGATLSVRQRLQPVVRRPLCRRRRGGC